MAALVEGHSPCSPERMTGVASLVARQDGLRGGGFEGNDVPHYDVRSLVERGLMGIIPLRDRDPSVLREGPHAMGGAVVPDLVWLESRVKMAQERPGLTRPHVDLTRPADASCSLGRLVTSPPIDERRQLVAPQRRRHATRTSTPPQCRWSDQVLTPERRDLIHGWRERDAGHEAVRQVGLSETSGRHDGDLWCWTGEAWMPSALPLQHLRHARLRRPIPTSARAWWRVPTAG